MSKRNLKHVERAYRRVKELFLEVISRKYFTINFFIRTTSKWYITHKYVKSCKLHDNYFTFNIHRLFIKL